MNPTSSADHRPSVCVEVAGLNNLSSLLSLSRVTIVIPTACKLVDEVFCQEAHQNCSF